LSRGKAVGSRNTSASNGDGAHLKKIKIPLDKPHKVWYNVNVSERDKLHYKPCPTKRL
jgi:hypothetical protein